MRRLIAIALTAGSLVLVGCASTPSPSSSAAEIPLPTPDTLTAADLDELAEAGDASTLATLLDRYPNAEVPPAERVRFIEPDEYAIVMADCMTSEGFPSVASADGGVESSFDTTQQEANATAFYRCRIKFPTDPKYLAPLNESQITYIYNYQTTVLTSCLEAAGYEVDEPPTLEKFLDSYTSPGGGWSPYANVRGGTLWVSLNKQCPQTPPHLYR